MDGQTNNHAAAVGESRPRPAPAVGQRVSCYGHNFTWTTLHKNPQELSGMIHSYDRLATEALDELDQLDPSPSSASASDSLDKNGEKRRDMFKLIRVHAHTAQARGQQQRGALTEFWRQVNEVPEWVDWAQIERGQKVYWRYVGAIVSSLSLLSLMGSFAYGRPVKVLDRTGSWKTENIMRRLLETTQYIIDVHRDLGSVQPGGDGWEASVRVRLLHAAVRRRIMALAEQSRGEYHDLGRDGVPINDLDSMITMSDFSSVVVFCGLPRQGIYPTSQEIVDFVALWRYMCWVMGTPTWLLATPEQGKAMMESILYAEVAPDVEGGSSRIIASNMINALTGQPPSYSSRGFLLAGTYWLNGDEVASGLLELERPGLWHKTIFAGQCWLYMVMGYSRRVMPGFLDDFISEHEKLTKKHIYKVLVHDKSKGGLGYKAKFSFKWVPSLGFRTPAQETTADRIASSGVLCGAAEATSLAVLVLTAALVVGGVMTGARMAAGMGFVLPAWLRP